MKNKITFKGTFSKVFLFVGVVLSAASMQAQTTLLSEDFSSIIAGNSTSTGGSSAPWEGNTNFPTVERAYQAGGSVKLGSGSAIGSITSKPLDLSQGGGNFTVAFDVKGWSTVEGSITVTVTGLTAQTANYTATLSSAAFENKVLSFSGGTAGSTVRIETTAKRAFIDNVVVRTVAPAALTAPVATEATAETATSFVANWNAVPGALSYRLDVSTTNTFSSFVPGYNNLTVLGTSQPVILLSSNTDYYYRVRAANLTLVSPDSNVITATTLCGIVTAPAVQPQTFCGSATASQLTGFGSGNLWYQASTGGAPIAGTAALQTGTYYVSRTEGECESARVPVSVTINPLPAEPSADDQTFCNGATVNELVPSGTGVRWYSAATGGEALDGDDVLTQGNYYVAQTVNGCESLRTEVAVTITTLAMPQGDAAQDYNTGDTLADLDVTGDNIVWYTDEELTNEVDDATVLQNGATYYAVTTTEDCESEPLAVTVTNVLGNASFTMAGLTYYPNPVNEVLTLSYAEAISSVVVYNLVGQIVLSKDVNTNAAQVDMSGLSAGSYIMKVTAGSQSKTIKIIKG